MIDCKTSIRIFDSLLKAHRNNIHLFCVGKQGQYEGIVRKHIPALHDVDVRFIVTTFRRNYLSVADNFTPLFIASEIYPEEFRKTLYVYNLLTGRYIPYKCIRMKFNYAFSCGYISRELYQFIHQGHHLLYCSPAKALVSSKRTRNTISDFESVEKDIDMKAVLN